VELVPPSYDAQCRHPTRVEQGFGERRVSGRQDTPEWRRQTISEDLRPYEEGI
jgi:hypothetical protein